MYLLTADVHLDDQPENEYRWDIFEQVRAVCDKHEISRVFCLGDLVDRKDRFSAAFVNRLFGELDDRWLILRGNHDTTLRPPAYFEFLPNYISEPTGYFGGLLRPPDTPGVRLLLLPFTPYPDEDWQNLNLAVFDSVFMHATVTGARIDNGMVLDNPRFPELPPHVKFYSGDIHHPQQVRNVTYVGAPHPTKFGDTYACRMLLLDENTFDIMEVIELTPPQKRMIDIRSAADLDKLHNIRPGDQIKIRLSSHPGGIDELARTEAQIAEWAHRCGVTIAGTEVIVDAPLVAGGVDTNLEPEAILDQFALHEQLTDDLLELGQDILKEVE